MRLIPMLLMVVACGKTTPAGAVGKTYDVRAQLPADVAKRAPSDDKATAHDQTFDVHGVKTKITWHTFEDGPNKYILSYGWEVVTPADGIEVMPMGDMTPINAGSAGAVIEQEIVRIVWRKKGATSESGGDMSFQIDATGASKQI